MINFGKEPSTKAIWRLARVSKIDSNSRLMSSATVFMISFFVLDGFIFHEELLIFSSGIDEVTPSRKLFGKKLVLVKSYGKSKNYT